MHLNCQHIAEKPDGMNCGDVSGCLCLRCACSIMQPTHADATCEGTAVDPCRLHRTTYFPGSRKSIMCNHNKLFGGRLKHQFKAMCIVWFCVFLRSRLFVDSKSLAPDSAGDELCSNVLASQIISWTGSHNNHHTSCTHCWMPSLKESNVLAFHWYDIPERTGLLHLPWAWSYFTSL